jgi:cytochrome c peroxidase
VRGLEPLGGGLTPQSRRTLTNTFGLPGSKDSRFGGPSPAAMDGPIKTFPLRGIKDSPPYLHDGRLLTLEDTVEFFNLVQGLKLSDQEKQDLVAFMRAL